MRAKTLIVLALVAAAAIVGSALLERGSAPDPAVSDGTLLYPGLTEAINGITRVRFSDPGTGEPVQLERTDAGWIVVQKDGYPADAGKIRQLLLRLAEARLAETKTANPELYPRLGVADPGAASSS